MSHGEHIAAPPTLYCPAGQRVAVDDVEPGGHANPELHNPLQFDNDSPGTEPYVPAGHGPLQLDEVKRDDKP